MEYTTAEGDEMIYKTENGYVLGERASALQKSIRRGLEEEAMFWALELYTKYMNYTWKRLQIIASEDIGLADPMAAVLVNSLWESHERIRKQSKGDVDPVLLGHAVLYLSRAPKSRVQDEFTNVLLKKRENGDRRPIPNMAYDKHTAYGRSLGHGETHFWKEASKLENEVEIPGKKYRDEAIGLCCQQSHNKKTNSRNGPSLFKEEDCEESGINPVVFGS